jgi:hypothetical protein
MYRRRASRDSRRRSNLRRPELLPYLEELEKQRQRLDRLVHACGWLGVVSIAGLLLVHAFHHLAVTHQLSQLYLPLELLRLTFIMGMLLGWAAGLGIDTYRRWQVFRQQGELRNLRQQQEQQELQAACATQECWVCHYWSHPAQFIKGFEHPCAVHPAGRPGDYCPDWQQRAEVVKREPEDESAWM